MKLDQSLLNGNRRYNLERSLAEEFQESLLPQLTGLLSDTEAVLRNEARLVEAKFISATKQAHAKIIFSVLGVGALFLALGLFLLTVIYQVAESFPELPLWIVTGAMSLVACLLGALLLVMTPPNFKGD